MNSGKIEMAFISRFRKITVSRSWKLAHYANAADIEFNFPLIQRIRFTRTDFDLKAHEKFSGRKFNILMPNKSELCSCGNVCWIRQNVLGCFATS
jgi:glycyl-tRNA synthetase (class II)